MSEHLRCCKACGLTKPLGDFYRHPGGHFLRCKVCCIAARKEAYRRDPEHTKAQVRRYRAEAKARRLAETSKASQ